ncbi:TonB-dependent receptor [Halioglobus sp. HI00S01]|uniref:TonB-dependent receptor n=1 Tax=Halioglobus sp. HI00S01 TaxID=1822214 RepID=UPI0007C3A56C|nr:TonB-dependent receptor [Halioglobus sp. HI00S01]KZX58992.1 TonB-dependent receptor [Halioglobus sp. HI00S01]
MRNRRPSTPVVAKTLLATAVATIVSPTFAQDLVLEEVIVTAQKRAATIQEISGTVNVVTGESMDRYSAFKFNDLEQMTAGLTLNSPNSRNNSIAMRGVSIDPEAGASAVVSVYWNDQPVREDVAFSQLYDMERVEILRGPQGTLQGRTSPGGAINLVTRHADLAENEGSIELSASDNEGFNGKVSFGGPIINEVFAARIAAVYDVNNSTNVEQFQGFDDPEAEALSARLSTVWQAGDNLNIKFVYQYQDRETDDPKAMNGTDNLGERPTLTPEDLTSLGDLIDNAEMEYDLANLQIDWDIGDINLASVTGYSESSKVSFTENDRANYVDEEIPTWQNSNTDQESISQELRLSTSDNDFWDWMVGIYYQNQKTATDFFANSVDTGIGFITAGDIPVDRKELGIFTFNTFYLGEATKLEVGLRYAEYDSFRRATVNYGGLTYLPPVFEPIIDIIEAGFAAAFPIEGVSEENQNTKEDTITGSVSINHDWTDNTTLYAAYNRGYRPSGISINPTPNIQFLPNGEDDLIHDEEKSDSFEVGFKGRYLDGRSTLNGALFYQKYDGYLGFTRGVQVLDDDGNPQDISGGVLFNGDATVWGAELEGQILLSEHWNAGGAVSYTKGEWDDGATKPCNDRQPGEVLGFCDIGGDALGGEPEWSVTANTEYFMPIGSNEWYVRALYKYTDERLNTEASAGITSRETFDANHVVNVYAGLRSSDYTWDVNIWAKNLLDSDEVVFEQGHDQFDILYSGGSYLQSNIQTERVIGATVRYSF